MTLVGSHCPTCTQPTTSSDRFCASCGSDLDIDTILRWNDEPPQTAESVDPTTADGHGWLAVVAANG